MQAASSIATAENNVTKAQDTLQSAQESLAQMRADPVAVQQKQSAVASAKANLAQAEDDLAYVKAGHDIELLQIKVENAQVKVDDALEQLEAATIVAPYAGVVASVGAGVGDKITASTVIVHLVNTSAIEVDAAVDEIDVASVEVGQRARITLDALPNAMLVGQVTAISPVSNSQSGVVTYALGIKVQTQAVPSATNRDEAQALNSDLSEIKEGMSATIEIASIQAENALLVPSQAIKRSGANQVAEVVVAEGKTEERVVQTGETNGTQTEIVSGLEEGEKVVVTASAASSSGTSQRSGQFQIFFEGGGPPGGGSRTGR